MEFMDFFNSLMEDHHPNAAHSDPPKMPNFFEVDKKKVCFYLIFWYTNINLFSNLVISTYYTNKF